MPTPSFAPEAVERRDSPGTASFITPSPPPSASAQATEAGTLYRPGEVAALGALARRHGLALHMDGARFANAVAALGCSPAELTWRAGVDALSFGATKNGALAAEAVIFFDPEQGARASPIAASAAGHLFSKMRFLSAQLDAYLADGLWLANARHANAMAARLGRRASARCRARGSTIPIEANEVFATLPEPAIGALERAGFGFYRWGGEGSRALRLVTAFDTRAGDVDAFIAAAARGAAGESGG